MDIIFHRLSLGRAKKNWWLVHAANVLSLFVIWLVSFACVIHTTIWYALAFVIWSKWQQQQNEVAYFRVQALFAFYLFITPHTDSKPTDNYQPMLWQYIFVEREKLRHTSNRNSCNTPATTKNGSQATSMAEIIYHVRIVTLDPRPEFILIASFNFTDIFFPPRNFEIINCLTWMRL